VRRSLEWAAIRRARDLEADEQQVAQDRRGQRHRKHRYRARPPQRER
jgi:hypothetical protein